MTRWIASFNSTLRDSWNHKGKTWVMSEPEASCGAYAFLWACAFALGVGHKRWHKVLRHFKYLSRNTALTGMEPEMLIAEFSMAPLSLYKPNHLSLTKKLGWLQGQLRQDRPAILCIERPFTVGKQAHYRFLDWHFVTACGYDRDAIYVIDPAPLADSDIMPPVPLRRIMKKNLIKVSTASDVYVGAPHYVKEKTCRIKIDGRPMWLAEKAKFQAWANNGWVISVAAS